MAADPRPADETAPPGPSLVERAIAAARRGVVRLPHTVVAASTSPRRPVDPAGAAVALVLIAAPLAIWVDARWLAWRAHDATVALAARAAPIAAARADHDRARGILAAAWRQPTLGTTIEAVARALPADAALLRVERAADGVLSIEVAAPDPDRVAAALRRDPALAVLRTVAQVPGDGTMRVTLEQPR